MFMEDYLHRAANRIWKEGKHKKECINRIQGLVAYCGNKPMEEYSADDIYRYLETFPKE